MDIFRTTFCAPVDFFRTKADFTCAVPHGRGEGFAPVLRSPHSILSEGTSEFCRIFFDVSSPSESQLSVIFGDNPSVPLSRWTKSDQSQPHILHQLVQQDYMRQIQPTAIPGLPPPPLPEAKPHHVVLQSLLDHLTAPSLIDGCRSPTAATTALNPMALMGFEPTPSTPTSPPLSPPSQVRASIIYVLPYGSCDPDSPKPVSLDALRSSFGSAFQKKVQGIGQTPDRPSLVSCDVHFIVPTNDQRLLQGKDFSRMIPQPLNIPGLSERVWYVQLPKFVDALLHVASNILGLSPVTVCGIPMREAQAQQSGQKSSFDVPLLCKGTLPDLRLEPGQSLQWRRTETWPQIDTQHTTRSVHRVSPLYPFTAPSQCLIKHLASGKPVSLVITENSNCGVSGDLGLVLPAPPAPPPAAVQALQSSPLGPGGFSSAQVQALNTQLQQIQMQRLVLMQQLQAAQSQPMTASSPMGGGFQQAIQAVQANLQVLAGQEIEIKKKLAAATAEASTPISTLPPTSVPTPTETTQPQIDPPTSTSGVEIKPESATRIFVISQHGPHLYLHVMTNSKLFGSVAKGSRLEAKIISPGAGGETSSGGGDSSPVKNAYRKKDFATVMHCSLLAPLDRTTSGDGSEGDGAKIELPALTPAQPKKGRGKKDKGAASATAVSVVSRNPEINVRVPIKTSTCGASALTSSIVERWTRFFPLTEDDERTIMFHGTRTGAAAASSLRALVACLIKETMSPEDVRLCEQTLSHLYHCAMRNDQAAWFPDLASLPADRWEHYKHLWFELREFCASLAPTSENHAKAQQAMDKLWPTFSQDNPSMGIIMKLSAKSNDATETAKLESQLASINRKNKRIIEVKRDENGNPILPVSFGALTVHALGSVVYDRSSYHTEKYLWPVGFKSSRQYGSTLAVEKRTTYMCEIRDGGPSPHFVITPEDDPEHPVVATSATAAWTVIVKKVNEMRTEEKGKKVFTNVSGPEYYGLAHPTIYRLLLELPNVDRVFTKEQIAMNTNAVVSVVPQTTSKQQYAHLKEKKEGDSLTTMSPMSTAPGVGMDPKIEGASSSAMTDDSPLDSPAASAPPTSSTSSRKRKMEATATTPTTEQPPPTAPQQPQAVSSAPSLSISPPAPVVVSPDPTHLDLTLLSEDQQQPTKTRALSSRRASVGTQSGGGKSVWDLWKASQKESTGRAFDFDGRVEGESGLYSWLTTIRGGGRSADAQMDM